MACVQLSPSKPFTVEPILKMRVMYHNSTMTLFNDPPSGSEPVYTCIIPVATPANSVATMV